MSKRFCVGCLLAITSLVACQVEPDDNRGPGEPPATPAVDHITLPAAAARLVPTTTAKGTGVRLDGRFFHAVVGRRNTGGTITTECLDNPTDAEAFMQRTAASASRGDLRR